MWIFTLPWFLIDCRDNIDEEGKSRVSKNTAPPSARE